MSATPKWEIMETYTVFDNETEKYEDITIICHKHIEIARVTARDSEERIRIAKMIVHRVKCHEQLVEALSSHAESCARQKGFEHCQECVNEGALCGTPVALEAAEAKFDARRDEE